MDPSLHPLLLKPVLGARGLPGTYFLKVAARGCSPWKPDWEGCGNLQGAGADHPVGEHNPGDFLQSLVPTA